MSLENTRVFIGNIPYLVSPEELQILFSNAGAIMKFEMFADERGKSRGCGVIQFSTRAEALKAISQYHHTSLYKRLITVKEDETFYMQQNRPVQISLKNMPMTVTWQQLKDVCREFGNVIRADVKIQKDGTSFGTALYETYTDAVKAAGQLNGALFNQRKVEASINLSN